MIYHLFAFLTAVLWLMAYYFQSAERPIMVPVMKYDVVKKKYKGHGIEGKGQEVQSGSVQDQ